MRFVIIGAGGIGGALGARLIEAGRDVVLLARGAHAAAMRTEGLQLSIPERVITVHPTVVETVADLDLQLGDVLILAVKGQDAPGLVADLAARPVPGGIGTGTAGENLPIYCAQNGVANEPAALRYFAQVHGVEVTLQATHLEPGKVTATGSPYSGVWEIGRYPSGSDDVDTEVAKHFTESGVLATVREDVMAWKRAKLLRNLRNALEAMCGPFNEDKDSIAAITKTLMAEGSACIEAAGLSVTPNEEFMAEIGQIKSLEVAGQGRMGGSTWQSVTRGLGSVETDYLNGEIVALGRLHGVPTPMNVRVQQRMAQFIRAGEAAGSVAPSSFLD